MKATEKMKRSLEKLGITVTGSERAWMMAIGLIALWAGVAHTPGRGDGLPVPSPARPQIELQGWTADVRSTQTMVSWIIPGALPPPDPRQRRPPCEPLIEAEIGGVCWTYLGIKPPCGKAWQHEDKCYLRALEAVKMPRVPSTGEPRAPAGVAAPE